MPWFVNQNTLLWILWYFNSYSYQVFFVKYISELQISFNDKKLLQNFYSLLSKIYSLNIKLTI